MPREIKEGYNVLTTLYHEGREWTPPNYDPDRPARQQVTEMRSKTLQAPEGCDEYNIWYGKFCGDRRHEKGEVQDAAETRCVILRDAGKTKADSKKNSVFCIHFAHGCCAMGAKCTFLHRLPGPDDEERLDYLRDCFGRERHNTDRDDMQGTGNINRSCKSLYVGNIRGRGNVDEEIYKHFSEWGPLERYRVMPQKGVAFLTYQYRCSAEFAKEAMKGQTLSNDEILLVRWAYDDPNPKREREEEEAGRNEALQRINQKGISLAPAEYHYPQQYQLPGNDPKMPRIGNESVATDYPDTSQQYGSGPLTMEDMERITKDAEARQREERLYSILDSIPSFGGAAASSSETTQTTQGVEYPTNSEYNLAAGGSYGHDGYQTDETTLAAAGAAENPYQYWAPAYDATSYGVDAFKEYEQFDPVKFQEIYTAYATQYPPDLAVEYARQYMTLQALQVPEDQLAAAYQQHSDEVAAAAGNPTQAPGE